jgi:hypothetical protein
MHKFIDVLLSVSWSCVRVSLRHHKRMCCSTETGEHSCQEQPEGRTFKSGVQQIMHSWKKDVVISIRRDSTQKCIGSNNSGRNFYVFLLGLFNDTSNV